MSMNPFCAQLLPMSENDNDNVHLEQLVDVVQPTITKAQHLPLPRPLSQHRPMTVVPTGHPLSVSSAAVH